MIRGLFLTLVFLLVLVGALIAFVPLGFVVHQSGAASAGAGWAQIQGTMLNGRISGMHFRGQEIGDVTLKLRPMSLLMMAPEYDVRWGSSGGQGSGTIKLSGRQLSAKDLRIQQQISSIDGLTAPVRAIGGTIRLQNGGIVLTPTGCLNASGQISTDSLSSIAQQYGRQFGLIEGPISCEEGDIHINMKGASERGETVTLDAQTSLLGAARFDVEVITSDAEVTLALSQIGFTAGEGGWYYHYEQEGGFAP